MQTINVKVCGDQWLNPDEVELQLNEIPPDELVDLDLRAEGASVIALGIESRLLTHCQQTGRDPKTLRIINWPNPVEKTAFVADIHPGHISHFFWFSDRYRPTQTLPSDHNYRFGFFVGRRSIPRGVMLWQHWKKYQDQTLFSLMQTYYPMPYPNPSPGLAVDQLEDWLPSDEIEEFVNWWSTVNIPSLDAHAVRDQYSPECNTNLDLLKHYHKFDIEIVCETYTRGNAFFVTEKTIRPLCAGRPVLVYAPRNFLKNLRGLGLQTWHSVWDETYDSLEGPERWAAMQTVIDQIAGQDQQQLWNQCQPIGVHNHARVIKLSRSRRPQ
jgi:hypothetical protein